MKFIPSKANGTIIAPPSKSMAHRYLICAALCNGISKIHNIDFSEDIKATINCLEQLGAVFTVQNNSVIVQGAGNKIFTRKEIILNCNESGSTLRFHIPLALLSKEPATFTGSQTLLSRPLNVYQQICNEQKIQLEQQTEQIHIQGQLKAGNFTIPGNISSQFVTGLLFALPLLSSDSQITLTQSIESKPYILMTQQVLTEFGITSEWKSENELIVKGNQTYNACEKTVEGDFSNSAFFDALNYTGGNLNIEGLNLNSLQGDKVFHNLFEKLKNWNNNSESIDISDCPDLGPVLFAVAAALKGGIFTGTARLKIKESDRGNAMCKELEKFGVRSEIKENQIAIISNKLQKPDQVIYGHNDHRIVMALSILLTITGGTLSGFEAVRKSFPDYFERLKTLGIQIELEGDEKWVG